MKIVNFHIKFLVGWLFWLGSWFLELIVFSVSSLSSWLVVSGWSVGLVGVEVFLGKFSIFASGFELVGWVVGS